MCTAFIGKEHKRLYTEAGQQQHVSAAAKHSFNAAKSLFILPPTTHNQLSQQLQNIMLPLGQMIREVAGIKQGTIVEPPLRFGSLLIICAGCFAYFKLPQFLILLIAVFGGTFLLIGMIVYIIFLVKSPDKLRTESYLLGKQSIELLGDKENTSPRNLEAATSATQIENTVIIDQIEEAP